MALGGVELVLAGVVLGIAVWESGWLPDRANIVEPAVKAYEETLEAAARTQEWWSSLEPIQQGPIIVPLVILGAFSLAVFMAVLSKWYLGTTTFIDRVPPPSKGIFIGDVPPSKFRRMECTNPATGEILGYVPAMDKEEVARRVRNAREAQKSWAKTTFAERRHVLYLIKIYVLQYQDEICRICAEDNGKTLLDAQFGEILNTLEKVVWVMENGEKILQPEAQPSPFLVKHRRGEMHFDPVGVIGAIQPWNYPFHNFMNTVISGLFAGNAVVVKVSDYTGWSGTYFQSMIQEILRQAGYPMELVQVVTGDMEAGQGLVDSGIDKLFFTGSTAVGRAVAKRAAEHLLPVELELGGKDPAVICDDLTDLPRVMGYVLRGIFQNSGQNCIAIERIFAQEGIYEKVVEILESRVRDVRVGDYRNLTGMVDMGAMTMGTRAIEHIQSLVNDAVAQGARLLYGGKELKICEGGHYYSPTLLVDVTPQMRIAKEEVFGPVATVLKFRDDDDCLDQIRQSPMGLASTVFVEDKDREERYIRELPAGMVSINEFGTHYVNQGLQFGGVGDSGYGRFGGPAGLRGCCISKTVTRDRWRRIRPTVPKHVDYPVLDNATVFVKEILYMVFGPDLVGRWDGMRNVLIMSIRNAHEPAMRPIDAYLEDSVEREQLIAADEDTYQ